MWTRAYGGMELVEYPEFWDAGHVMPPNSSEQTGVPGCTIRIPVASNYDLDNDYDYIMSRALRSYRQHRECEKAETRRGPLKSAYIRRHQLRPKTAPPARFIEAIKVRHVNGATEGQSLVGGHFVPRVDAIKEVSEANPVSNEERSPRRVLQVAKVDLNMMQDANRKTASYMKRNAPAHPWHSHSYPSVRPMEKFVRPPHAYMSASVGERDLSSALSSSSSRSSSAKSSPQHRPMCRPSSGASKSSTNSKLSPNNKYYYDGGLFTHPKENHSDYFVIHPDWVSESMSIQKLSLSERTKQLPPKSKSMTWPQRRCYSAPPSKYRNPITWENIQTT
ncbi:uncharacterized protein LOC128226833 isoform X2 [Mya arenaria]|uniref:uncharacterized protein LOC128226833 isoform X2 n=1 Tax=Mya arenaria TaxID=6604 RepID=UPI0022E7BB26|nr:uncharacterized protein LOC128226833 isoform X2 [Mya arenaria]